MGIFFIEVSALFKPDSLSILPVSPLRAISHLMHVQYLSLIAAWSYSIS
jgi:hypothetical protein